MDEQERKALAFGFDAGLRLATKTMRRAAREYGSLGEDQLLRLADTIESIPDKQILDELSRMATANTKTSG